MFHATTYNPERAQAEITRLLRQAGARRISVDYHNGQASGMSFTLETPHGEQEFLLPVRVERVRATLQKQGVLIRSRPLQHATAVAWRTVLEWLKLQLAVIETEQAAADEVLLPYLLVRTEDGRHVSVYEQYAGLAALPAAQ